MYNLLRLEYSDEILKNIGGCILSIFRPFHDISIYFRSVTGQRNLKFGFQFKKENVS